MHTIVAVDTKKIRDWVTFHEEFARVMGFPAFYGGNLNAWIDCMTSVDEPDDGMSRVHAPPGGVLVLALSDAGDLAARCPEIYQALVEAVAFVNHRRIEMGETPVLALSYAMGDPLPEADPD